MDYPGYTPSWLEDRKAGHTAREIAQQPELWAALATTLTKSEPCWRHWLAAILDKPDLRVVMTGAGTSAFAGEMLAPPLRESTGLRIEPVATTDIVASPRAWLDPALPTLLVSFARSGDSPESVAAVEIADRLLPDCHHLILTCNADGALARYADVNPRAHCVLMPDGANDRSFAMTSSLSTMYVAAALMLGATPLPAEIHMIEAAAELCRRDLGAWTETARAIASAGNRRAIFLGSGGFAGLAQEAALKMLELTAGRVATRFDTPLGFRHGPKFMIDRESCVVLFRSPDPYTRLYEDDLLRELENDGIARNILALDIADGDPLGSAFAGPSGLWLCLPFLVFAQILAFETSLALSLTPDNPCPTGEVNRVVKGVTIHPFTN